MTARFMVGDSLDVLRSMPDGSVDLVLTSPPFLALRSYLPADHPDKAKEIGSEATPGEFLDVLLDHVVEWRRVLAPHGSICVELGDTYSGSGGAGGDYGPDGMRGGQNKFTGTALADRKNKVLRADGNRLQQGPGWPLAKSLCLIPELFRVALVYGFNPLTGRQTERWRARNVVRWCRPNPPVGALGDKFRPGTSDMVVACTSNNRFFDLDAVREPASPNTNPRTPKGVAQRDNDCKTAPDGNRDTLAIQHLHATAPPLDWWKISTEPYKGSHYATWPTELLVRPILAMCPSRVCTTCGEPARRIVDAQGTGQNLRKPGSPDDDAKQRGAVSSTAVPDISGRVTVGWTDCGHDTWRAGVVLDPFAGSGTTLAVAVGHGRDAIGIDLDERNADLARQRVGMFLAVEGDRSAAPPAETVATKEAS